jgi:hypothetical protein
MEQMSVSKRCVAAVVSSVEETGGREQHLNRSSHVRQRSLSIWKPRRGQGGRGMSLRLLTESKITVWSEPRERSNKKTGGKGGCCGGSSINKGQV